MRASFQSHIDRSQLGIGLAKVGSLSVGLTMLFICYGDEIEARKEELDDGTHRK